eukprot:31324-Amphidinium_carterae.1
MDLVDTSNTYRPKHIKLLSTRKGVIHKLFASFGTDTSKSKCKRTNLSFSLDCAAERPRGVLQLDIASGIP